MTLLHIAEMKPDCKYCHLNDLYTLPEEIPSEEVLARCLNCHKEKGLQETFVHISHRFKHKTSRPPLEIVELCASCHADKDFQNVVGFTGPRLRQLKPIKIPFTIEYSNLGGPILLSVSTVTQPRASMISGLHRIPNHQFIRTTALKHARQWTVIPRPALSFHRWTAI